MENNVYVDLEVDFKEFYNLEDDNEFVNNFIEILFLKKFILGIIFEFVVLCCIYSRLYCYVILIGGLCVGNFIWFVEYIDMDECVWICCV